MLRTLDEGYKVLQLRGQRLNPLLLVLHDDAGQRPGAVAGRPDRQHRAPARTPTWWCWMRGRRRRWRCAWKQVDNLANELFLLQTCGDDRAVVETYVAGKAMKSGLACEA